MKKWIALGAFVVLAAGTWWLGLPAYRTHKEMKFAAEARHALDAHDYRRALLSARQVLILNQKNVAACEVMAELADMARSPQAIVWRRRVAEAAPTISNQVMLASCALRYEQGPFPVAAQTLAQLAGKADSSVSYHVVAAQLALKQQRLADAEKHFESAIQLEPTNELHRLNLAVVELESRDAARSLAAHQQLVSMQANPQWGDYALRSLSNYHLSRREYQEAYDYSERLLKHARATFEDRLDHLTVLHEAKKDFSAYAEGLKRSANTNAAQVFALAARLVSCDAAAGALAWLKSLPPAMQNEQPVPLALANTYAALKDWHALEEYLSTQRWKDQEFVRLAMLAYAVRNQKDEAVAHAHWDRAIKAVADRPELLGLLAQMAAGWHWTSESEDVLWRVARGFPNERWAIDALSAGYARQRNTRGLYAVYSLLMERDSANTVAQNNCAALSFLLHTNIAQAHQVAGRVYHADTNNYGFISTYAWSLHLQGHTAEALKLMERIDAAHLGDPSVASYYGALLAAAGQEDKAKAFLAKADAAQILPEEKEIVEEARRKIK